MSEELTPCVKCGKPVAAAIARSCDILHFPRSCSGCQADVTLELLQNIPLWPNEWYGRAFKSAGDDNWTYPQSNFFEDPL